MISDVLASWENTLTLHYHYYYNYYSNNNHYYFPSNKDRALLFLELHGNNCILLALLPYTILSRIISPVLLNPTCPSYSSVQ